MSEKLKSKDSETVETLLKQIKEITEDDSSSSTLPENVNGLIEDITITSSQENLNLNKKTKSFTDSFSAVNKINDDESFQETINSDEEVDPDLQFFLMKISKMTDHRVSSLGDVAKEFQNIRGIGNSFEDFHLGSNNDCNDFIQQFNKKFNVATSSLQEVLEMMEILQENQKNEENINSIQTNIIPNKVNLNLNFNKNQNGNYFPEIDICENEQNDNIEDDSYILEKEKKINDLILQQKKRRRPFAYQNKQANIQRKEFGDSESCNRYGSTRPKLRKRNNHIIKAKEIEEEDEEEEEYFSSSNSCSNHKPQKKFSISKKRNKKRSKHNKNRSLSYESQEYESLYSNSSSRSESYNSKSIYKFLNSKTTSDYDTNDYSSQNDDECGSNEYYSSNTSNSHNNKRKRKTKDSSYEMAITSTNQDTSSQSKTLTGQTIESLNSNVTTSPIQAKILKSSLSPPTSSSVQQSTSPFLKNPNLGASTTINSSSAFIKSSDINLNHNNQNRRLSSSSTSSFSSKKRSLSVEKPKLKTMVYLSSDTSSNSNFSSDNIMNSSSPYSKSEKLYNDQNDISKSETSKISSQYSESTNDSKSKFNTQDYANSISVNEVEKLRNLIKKLLSENEKLKNNENDLNKKNSLLENQNQELNNQISIQKDQISNLNATKENLQKAISTIEDFMRSSSEETIKLAKQREQLLSLINSQNKIYQGYDINFEKVSMNYQTLQSSFLNDSNPSSNEPTSLEKIYSTILHLSNSVLEPKIKEDNEESTENKIIFVVQKLCRTIQDFKNQPINQGFNATATNNINSSDDTEKLNEQIRALKNKNAQTIQVLEGELHFLQKLANSTELQKVVFYRPSQGKSLGIDEDTQSELIRHCVVVQKYIDDTIGFYSKEQIYTLTKDFDSIDAQRVFNVMQTEELEQKLKYAFSFIQNDKNKKIINSENFSEIKCDYSIIDLIVAILIMNEILQNHIVDIQAQLVYTSHQNQKLQTFVQDGDTNQTMLNDANELIKKYQHREKKIIKLINQLFKDEASKHQNKSNQISQGSNGTDIEVHSQDSKSKAEKPTSLLSNIRKLAKEYRTINDKLTRKNTEIITVINKAEEMKKSYKTKIDKKNKTIKTLKGIVGKQKDEIEKSVQDKTNYRTLFDSMKSENQQKIKSIQSKLHDLAKVIEDLRNIVTQLQKESHKQIKMIKKEYGSQLSSKLSSSRSESYEAEISSAKNALTKNQILKSKIKENKEKYNQIVADLKDKLVKMKNSYDQLTNNMNELKNENAKISNENYQSKLQLEHLKSELESANIFRRSLEIKLHSIEEKAANEKRTLQSQLTAKLNSLQTDFQNQLTENEIKHRQIIQRAFEIASSQLNNNFKAKALISDDMDDGSAIIEIVRKLCTTIDDMKTSSEQLYSIIDDAKNARHILQMNRDLSTTISEAISNLLKKNKELNSKVENLEKSENHAAQKYEKLECESKALEKQAINSNQWEVWARRINGIVNNDARSAILSADQLRQSLEESILASVSQRTLLFRIRTLREEKKALIRFDRNLLTERINVTKKLDNLSSVTQWGIVFIIYSSIRRMQQLAGCVPLRIGHANPSIVDDSLTYDLNRPNNGNFRMNGSFSSSSSHPPKSDMKLSKRFSAIRM